MLELLKTHQYLILAVLGVGYLLRLLQPDSKFPIDVPARYQAAVLLVLGQVYGVLIALQAGTYWVQAVLSGLSVSLIVVVLRSLFQPEPKWLKAIAFVFPPPSSPPAMPTQDDLAVIVEPKPPVAPFRSMFRVVAIFGVLYALLSPPEQRRVIRASSGCTAQQAQVVQNAILTTENIACIIDNSGLLGTSTAVIDVQKACNFASNMIPSLEAFLALLEAKPEQIQKIAIGLAARHPHK